MPKLEEIMVDLDSFEDRSIGARWSDGEIYTIKVRRRSSDHIVMALDQLVSEINKRFEEQKVMGKAVINSKTIQGQTFLLFAFVGALVTGHQPDNTIIEAVTALMAVGGYAFGVYGRIKAGEPITGVISAVAQDFSEAASAASEVNDGK